MRCSNCGNELTEGARVCPRCGTRQNLTNSERSVGSGASKKSLGAVLGLVAVIVVVLVVGVLGVAKVTNTSIGSLISGDVKKYNDKYYGYNNLNNSYGGSSSSYNGGGNNNGGGNQDGGFDEKDYERYEYNPETRIIGSKNKKTNKVLTYYDTPIENISVEENEVIYANNELMLTAKKGTDLDTVEKTVAKYGGKVVGINQYVDMYQVQFNRSYNYEELNSLINNVTEEAIFESGSVNAYIFDGNTNENEYTVINDKELKNNEEYYSKYTKDWWLKEVEAYKMWDSLNGYNNLSECNVGIIDCGTYELHEDLRKVVNKHYKEFDTDYDKTDSHGTHVAGIIGAEHNDIGIAGVCNNCRISVLPALTYTNRETVRQYLKYITDEEYKFDTLDALSDDEKKKLSFWEKDNVWIERDDKKVNIDREDYSFGSFAFKLHALTELISADKCNVVNISMYWAIHDNTLFHHIKKSFEEFFENCINKGYKFVIVKTAGNSSENCQYCRYSTEVQLLGEKGLNDKFDWFGNKFRYQLLENIENERVKERIIIVGSSDIDHKSSSFSNYGKRVDIFAPGTNIYSCIYNGSEKDRLGNYWYKSGTSMAAPVVTGVIANMFSVNPNLKVEEVKDILQKTATKDITDNGGYNHKIINGYEAVKYVIGLNDEEGIIDISSGYVDLGGDKYKVIDKDDKNGKALIVAIDAVDAKPYFVSNTNIETSCTWGTSSLRKWLNEDYYNGIDEKQRNAVLTTTVKDENSFFSLGSTEDKIFILSKSELENYFGKGNNENEYSDVDINRQVVASSKAVSNGAYVGKKDYETNGGKIKLKEGKTIYWVRNQGKDDSTKAMVVNTGGTISTDGVDIKGDFTDVNGDHGKICVRPAMWVRYKYTK